MLPYKIYYDGGETYSGNPFDAPAFGVLVIVEQDKECGKKFVIYKDYYVWTGEHWLGVDYIGMLDYLAQPGAKKVIFGRMVKDDYWNEVMRQAYEDPDFPPKTALAYNEDKRFIHE